MSWIKKSNDVEVNVELESDFSKIDKTDAYEVKVTDCHIQESRTEGSKSISLVVGVENAEGDVNTTYFTLTNKDGDTFYTYNKKFCKVSFSFMTLKFLNFMI